MMRFYFQLVLIALMLKRIDGSFEQKFGKVNITDHDSCGFYCEQVFFKPPFKHGETIRVFPTLSHENHPAIADKDEPAVVILKYVDHAMFTVCVTEPGQPWGKVTTNWLALNSYNLPLGIQSGNISYDIFTSGSSCAVVKFTQSFVSPPKILLSVRKSKTVQRKDAMSYWAKDIDADSFTVCLKEITGFSGIHKHMHVDWVALSKPFSENLTDLGSLVFPNVAQPSGKDNYSYCQRKRYAQRFFAPPVVIVSGHHARNSNNIIMSDESILAWVKNVNKTSFELCAKDGVKINGKHKPIIIDFAILGDLDPCIGVKCFKFSVCRAFGPYDARCVCVEDCPTTGQSVCASNGRSFDNQCLYQLEVCRTNANYTFFHPGSCKEFPVVKGRWNISQVPDRRSYYCQKIGFESLMFYPDKRVHVQVSVSHVKNVSQVHDAAVSWVENVSENGFKVCVMESGRNEGPPHGFATIEWIAYQGTPQGGASGVEKIAKWWTGSKCQTIDISSNGFSDAPTVFATAEHHRRSIKHDAASLWLEDVTSSSFKICLRELQNFDGIHQDISVYWLALGAFEEPLFSESESVEFVRNTLAPLASTNFAECKDVSFSRNYSSPPTVVVSPKHSSFGKNSLDPHYNSITAWIESITKSGFRTCVKEFYVNQAYDAVTLTFVVLQDICEPGWTYRKGFCYKNVSHCERWPRASIVCQESNSNLVHIKSIEEDVFVQHLHQGRESWTGLNDRANEGVYLWTNGERVTYTRWSPQMSSSKSAADCVYTFGRNRNYYWKTEICKECKGFTCKKDYDECTRKVCDSKANCFNTIGSYTCLCRHGYTGNGKNCSDFDECLSKICDPNANCVNTIGSYVCQCRDGFIGNGKSCADIDECSNSSSACDPNADCTNSIGTYTCKCRSGYSGNGKSCQADCRDPGKPYNGYRRGSSFTYGSTVYFSCQSYYYRLRGASSATCLANGKWSNPTPSCYYSRYGR